MIKYLIMLMVMIALIGVIAVRKRKAPKAVPFNLQLLADAGTLVNATGRYQNAYDASDYQAFDANNTLAAELKGFYDTELLENARPKFVYAQFAKKQPLPRGKGTTVEWRKWNTFAKAAQLTEGVIPTGQKFGLSYIRGEISQYGTYATVSDKLELHAYDDVILGAAEEMGASMAETQEYLIRQALLTGTNVLYADNLNADGSYKNTPTSPATMGASATNGFAYLTPDVINKAVTKMKKNRAEPQNGRFYCVIHPSVAYDLRSNPDWIDYHKYAAVGEIMNGEIGELHGVRFLESDFAPVLGGDTYKNMDNGVTYACFMIGKDAFGVIDPEGGAAQMIVHDKDEIGGPLNQFSTIGYKLESNGATLLYPERVLRIMVTSSYSASDTAN